MDQRIGPLNGQAVVQVAARGAGRDRGAHFVQHGAGIQARIHLHDGDARGAIARFDGALNGRRAAPAGKQRGVYVDAAQARRIQHCLGEQQPVGHHDHHIGVQGRQLGLGLGVFQADGLIHRQRLGLSQLFDRAGSEFTSPTGRAVGLGVDRHHFVFAVEKGSKAGGGEVWRASKNNA